MRLCTCFYPVLQARDGQHVLKSCQTVLQPLPGTLDFESGTWDLTHPRAKKRSRRVLKELMCSFLLGSSLLAPFVAMPLLLRSTARSSVRSSTPPKAP